MAEKWNPWSYGAAPSKFGPIDTSLGAAGPQIGPIGDPTAAQDAVTLAYMQGLLGSIGLVVYGDGSDGALVADGVGTVLGVAAIDSTYTMVRDVFASSLSIATGINLIMNGFRLFVAGTLTLTGTAKITNDGNAAAVAVAGAITNNAASTGVGRAGGAGRSGSSGVGVAGVAQTIGFPGATGGAGGAGGGDGTNIGGAGGAFTALTAIMGGARFLSPLLLGMVFGTTTGTAALVSLFGGGSGGGGGAVDSTGSGGGGGGAGGVLIVAALTVVSTANTHRISANGGAGAAAVAPTNGGGGGGGGGGVAILITRSATGPGGLFPNPTAAGGAGGAKIGANGVAGAAGTTGTVLFVAA